MAGTLFVVATPIGNLEDLTFRALRTLREVDLIAAEDTRRTSKLLAHYQIRKSMVSLHEHNEYRETPRLIARLQAGASIAVVSDAGTPGVSDPGHLLVRAAREAGVTVTPIPGPSAVTTALSASGEPASQFRFMGFPPRSGKARDDWFRSLAGESATAVFFEAPHRITETLREAATWLADRPIYVHRELTKINETLVKYHSQSADVGDLTRGEIVVVVGVRSEKLADPTVDAARASKAAGMFECLTNQCAFSDNEAQLLVTKALDIEANELRKAVKKERIATRRREQGLS